MTFFRILYYGVIRSFIKFPPKYRFVTMELGKNDEHNDILLWGVATEEGWKMMKGE